MACCTRPSSASRRPWQARFASAAACAQASPGRRRAFEAAAALFSAASASASFFRRSVGVLRASCASARVARARASAARFSASSRARRRRGAAAARGPATGCAPARRAQERAVELRLRGGLALAQGAQLLPAPSPCAGAARYIVRQPFAAHGHRGPIHGLPSIHVPQAPPQRLQNRVSVGAFITVDTLCVWACGRFSIGPGDSVQVGSRGARRGLARALAKLL